MPHRVSVLVKNTAKLWGDTAAFLQWGVILHFSEGIWKSMKGQQHLRRVHFSTLVWGIRFLEQPNERVKPKRGQILGKGSEIR
jgi:hypothetical protein